MKKRLLAFFLAFAMVFSLVPVSAFAAEADAAALYTGITTESGEEVTVEYVETVVGESAWSQSINTPYYHVTIPEGTENVLLTYPESVNLALSGDDSAGFFFRNTYPGQSTIDLGGSLPVETNDDGSKTVTVPVENFMLTAGGSTAVGMMYYVDSDNLSAAEFFDFVYAAPTHAVTLTSGDGYTLNGEATAEDGKDYSFTVTILDGYEMGDAFVVKANGEALTAGESGGYTVENVTADLTITVEGVVKKQPVSHTVTLTSGDDYTLTGETSVADGADYTFSLKFDNYYGAGANFAVKANGTALTANEDGTYTVKNVTTDLTITVEGVARLYKIFLPHGWSQFTMSAYDGYADPSKDPSIAKGGDYKFKVTPNDGFAVRDNNYDVSFSGRASVNVEVKDGYAVVTLTNILGNGEVKIQGVKQIITVNLPKNEGFTAAAAEGTKTPVLKGDSYSFTVTVAEDYEKTDDFAVKANGTALTANEDGSYTIADISADQTITVEGVKKSEVPAKAGLSSLKFGDTNAASKAGAYEISPEFDPAVKEYTLLIPDSYATAYAWAVRGADMSSSAKITAQWTSVKDNTAKSVSLTSGKTTGQILTGFMGLGDVTNTATFTVTDGDFSDTYTVTLARTPSLTALSLDGVQFNESFAAATREYTANTSKDSVTVNATPRAESYKVTYNGKTENTVALELGENTIEVVVTNASGSTSTYTIKVTRVEEVTVDFALTPADAKVTVWDSLGSKVSPVDGKYSLMSGAEYSYLVQKDGYVSQKNNFTLSQSGTIEIALDVATGNPDLDKTIYAQWGNFRNGDNNLGITNAKTPYAPEDAELLWAVKYGSGWAAAPGSPIIVDGDIVTYVGSTIKRLDRMTGKVVAEGKMVGSSSFSIVPMTYADGMLFVGLSGGTIQAFNAKTLESLWVYTDELGGQPNCPITYKNGYIYAGFWNGEEADANFVCINTIDEKHGETNEAKYATWSYTRTGGFYWAGAYATDQFVVVGTDDGAKSSSETASLLVFDRLTGELVDSHDGIRGDIRSNVSYDPDSDRVFFTSKGGVLCNAKIDWSTGKITDFKQTVIVNAAGSEYAMSTCTPSVYNGRIYIGVAGDSQFGANSGHAIAVYDLNSDGSMTQAYAYSIMGYPQTSAMVTTAYASEDGYVYIYLPYNYTPGGVSVLKDKKGQTAPLTTTDSGYSEVFTPVGSLAQYCLCSTVADEYGTIYYKNDSAYMMAITSKIESLEISQYPSSITENEDGTVKADGLKVVTKLKNGEERDVTNYVTLAKSEETGGYVVSYTYGFDDASYGLKTLTADIVDYKVTLPEGEGYTVTGETTVHGGENYTFTVTVATGYEKTESFAVKANDQVLTAAKDGTYTVENVSADLTITVEGVAKKVLEPVTVYFSFSHDADYEQCDETGEVMALKKIEVPYFDLANYGLKRFYFRSENYSETDPVGAGTSETAYGKVTMLHLIIYATEVYYCGIDPADAGQGYLYDNNLIGVEEETTHDTDVIRVSGSPGSLYMTKIWNYDENLNYYLNYAYPLASNGWGSTCDQILIHDEDIITVGHFSERNFYSDPASIFNYIESDKVAPVQGDEITLSLTCAGGGMNNPDCTTTYTPITSCPEVYYLPADDVNTGVVSTWIPIGTADENGKLTVDTSNMAPGEYIFAMAGQPGAENRDSICSTPGGVRVTIQAKPVVKGDVNGDGTVDTFDVTALYKAISNVEELDASVADVNGDGVVDVFDVMAIYDIIKNAD